MTKQQFHKRFAIVASAQEKKDWFDAVRSNSPDAQFIELTIESDWRKRKGGSAYFVRGFRTYELIAREQDSLTLLRSVWSPMLSKMVASSYDRWCNETDVTLRLMITPFKAVPQDTSNQPLSDEESRLALLLKQVRHPNDSSLLKAYGQVSKLSDGPPSDPEGFADALNALLTADDWREYFADCHRYGFPSGALGEVVRKKELWHVY
jgi:hypothetical protein